MESDYIGHFQNMNNNELLLEYAFRQNNYEPEASNALKSVLESRGITEDEIIQFRKKCVKNIEFKLQCTSCLEYLELEEDEIYKGNFECPECGMVQLISYPPDSYNCSIKNRKDTHQDLKGIDGWLAFWAISFVVSILFGIINLATRIEEGYSVDVLPLVLAFAILVYTFIVFLNTKKIFPKLAIAILVIPVAGYAGKAILWRSHEALASAIAYSIPAVIWTLYFIKSKRVKATFVNDGWIPFCSKAELKKRKYDTKNDEDNHKVINESSSQIKKESDEIEYIFDRNDEKTVICPNCQAQIKPAFKFCPSCGQPIDKYLCNNCGFELNRNFEYCPKCGFKIC